MIATTKKSLSASHILGGEGILHVRPHSAAEWIKLVRKGIPAGCVNGGCGVCKIRVLNGTTEVLGPVSRAHVSAEEEAQGYTLACRVGPTCEVTLEVAGKMIKPFSKGFPGQATPPATTK